MKIFSTLYLEIISGPSSRSLRCAVTSNFTGFQFPCEGRSNFSNFHKVTYLFFSSRAITERSLDVIWKTCIFLISWIECGFESHEDRLRFQVGCWQNFHYRYANNRIWNHRSGFLFQVHRYAKAEGRFWARLTSGSLTTIYKFSEPITRRGS